MKYLILTLGFLFTSTSQAFIHLEPYLGSVVSGEADSESRYRSTTGYTVINSETEYSKGLLFGAKLGVDMTLFNFGLDYSKSRFSQNHKISGDTFNNNGTSINAAYADAKRNDSYDSTHIGLYLGTRIVPFIKISGTYFLSSKIKDINEDATSLNNGLTNFEDELKGSGWGVEIGLTSFFSFDINFGYRKFEYDKMNDVLATTNEYSTIGDNDMSDNTRFQSYEAKEYIVTLSFPWTPFSGSGSSSID